MIAKDARQTQRWGMIANNTGGQNAKVGAKRKDHLPPKRKEGSEVKTQMEIEKVYLEDDVISMFDEFHKVMTGEPGYGFDKSVAENPWLMFRINLLQKCYLAVVATGNEKQDKNNTGKWIKCEDDLPAEMDWVQFTRKDPVQGRVVSCGSFIRGGLTGEKFIDGNDDKFTPIEEVIAWKYLDAPYEGD